MARRVHVVEWVFAAPNAIKPRVTVPADSARKPRAPFITERTSIGQQSFAFSGRSQYIGLAVSAGTTSGCATPQVATPYWTDLSASSLVAPPNIPIRQTYRAASWVEPDVRRAFLGVVGFGLVPIAVALVNSWLLPWICSLTSGPTGMCARSYRWGFLLITDVSCSALLCVAFAAIVVSSNPLDCLVEYHAASRWAGQALVLSLPLLPGLVAWRGIALNVSAAFHNRRHFLALICLVFNGVAISAWLASVSTIGALLAKI
jgi:hypothetical protein